MNVDWAWEFYFNFLFRKEQKQDEFHPFLKAVKFNFF